MTWLVVILPILMIMMMMVMMMMMMILQDSNAPVALGVVAGCVKE